MPFSEDTSPEARRVLLQSYRAMTPERRVEVAMQATEAMREMVRTDIAQHHPHASDEERHVLFLERWLGVELAREALSARRPILKRAVS
jgi:hypothetical protein